MRSARLLLATATATAALAIAAPGAFAADGGDWDNGDSSYSKEHDKDSKHDKPNGGMHTGGGALTAVNEGDWSKGDSADESKKGDWDADKTDKEEQSKGSWDSSDKEEESGKGDWSGKHEKPSGGMHTGGGALASPGVTAGGMAALAVVGAGAFAMRRRNAADGVS
ncbi:hypothetical protein ACKI1I_12320 [Streptomyces turgidiscabies]|uniref:LPXTG cell wall anchor domain protein n=1 Tax=Streptomyces turgidiscabies (strain Car8) TaxID=698760 RepID=L7EZL9_STRT8|nr:MULTISPECIES: hypothetical protein [Streptomyces]ELP64339.1 hypothetical protein STRTUCAR8_01179 [Streptomyces turgidiscabies Car8]MDX3494688.1 hypothetical protein [Streptomyces turgidiscabies]GAQ71296.1 hypothetical protein T45_03038 [Streptomyces turgidiscabies]